MSKDFNFFSCSKEKCSNNCCGSYSRETKKISDLLQPILNIKPYEIPLLDEEAKFLIKKGFLNKIYKKGDIYFLKLNKDNSCVFLNKKTHLCDYLKENKKWLAICSAYPLYFDPLTGFNILKSCHGLNRGNFNRDNLRHSLSALKKLFNFFLKKTSK